MPHLLEVTDLATSFQTEAGKVHAVNGISYVIDPGGSIGIVGESGSGKTVSVLSIMGMLPTPPARIESGTALFNGRNLLDLSSEERRKIRGREIAMVFQDPMTCLDPVLTIGQQMSEGMQEHFGISRKEADDRAVELLSRVSIPNARDRLKDYPHQFSGGQRQRVDIAMALSCNPTLLIADEPTTALDVTVQAQIVEMVLRLQEQLGMAILWITHDLGILAGLVQQIMVMYSGLIIEKAPTIALYEHTAHPYTLGLLDSLPSMDLDSHKKLIPIEGRPPNLLAAPTYCPFAPRCRWAKELCWLSVPPLMEVEPGHTSACWRSKDILDISSQKLLNNGYNA